MAKIQDVGTLVWPYVPTAENPCDLGTRGVASPISFDQFWLKGPKWLTSIEEWPEKVEVKETAEAQTEALSGKDVALLQKQGNHNSQETWAEELMQKHKYWKLLKITAFIRRFFGNWD